jgi:DNA modification methylase
MTDELWCSPCGTYFTWQQGNPRLLVDTGDDPALPTPPPPRAIVRQRGNHRTTQTPESIPLTGESAQLRLFSPDGVLRTNAVHEIAANALLDAIPAGLVDAVITDPPYQMNNPGNVTGKFKLLAAHGWSLPLAWLDHLPRILGDSGVFYIWCGLNEVSYLRHALEALGATILSNPLWIKTNPIPSYTKRVYRNSWEMAIYGTFGKVKYFRQGVTQQELRGVWHYPIVGGKRRYDHPTQKPLGIHIDWIVNSVPAGGLVVDPFCGTGTTAHAAQVTGRRYIAGDIETKYVQIARQRLAQPLQMTLAGAG